MESKLKNEQRAALPATLASKLLNEDDLCRLLGKSKAWAQRARFEGTGPKFYKAGRRPLYPIKEVEAWLEQSLSSNTTEFKKKKKG
ncbi:MAG: hypothetical protein WA081_05275 [Desulfosalsimonadaceae bacterium]